MRGTVLAAVLKSTRARVLAVLLAGAVLLAVLYAIGLALPSSYSVTRTVVMQGPSPQVWHALSRPARWRSWVPWLADDPVLVLIPTALSSGTGAGLRWQSARQGSGQLSLTACDSATGCAAFTLAFDGWPPLTGTLVLAPRASEMQVCWTLQGTAESPFHRLLALRADAMLGPDLEQGLINLARLALPAQP